MKTAGVSVSLPSLSLSLSSNTHVLLQQRALLAVVRVRHAGGAAHAAPPRVGAVVALVTNADERLRADKGIAHHALAVAPLAHPADGCTCEVCERER